MRIQSIHIICLYIILLLSACQPAGKKELTDAQRHEIAATIRQQTQEMFDRMREVNLKDFEELTGDLWVDSSDPSWMNNPAIAVYNLDIITTSEKYKEMLQPLVDENPTFDIKIVEDYVSVLSENIAVYVCKLKSTVTDSMGHGGQEETAVNSTVYIHEDGKWKILHNHQSYD